jgi:hypothetical protein
VLTSPCQALGRDFSADDGRGLVLPGDKIRIVSRRARDQQQQTTIKFSSKVREKRSFPLKNHSTHLLPCLRAPTRPLIHI